MQLVVAILCKRQRLQTLKFSVQQKVETGTAGTFYLASFPGLFRLFIYLLTTPPVLSTLRFSLLLFLMVIFWIE